MKNRSSGSYGRTIIQRHKPEQRDGMLRTARRPVKGAHEAAGGGGGRCSWLLPQATWLARSCAQAEQQDLPLGRRRGRGAGSLPAARRPGRKRRAGTALPGAPQTSHTRPCCSAWGGIGKGPLTGMQQGKQGMTAAAVGGRREAGQRCCDAQRASCVRHLRRKGRRRLARHNASAARRSIWAKSFAKPASSARTAALRPAVVTLL